MTPRSFILPTRPSQIASKYFCQKIFEIDLSFLSFHVGVIASSGALVFILIVKNIIILVLLKIIGKRILKSLENRGIFSKKYMTVYCLAKKDQYNYLY